MKKTLSILLCSFVTVFLIGCSSGGEEGSANVNKDVQTGAPSGAIDGAAPAGDDGAPSTTSGSPSGGGASTPTSTP